MHKFTDLFLLFTGDGDFLFFMLGVAAGVGAAAFGTTAGFFATPKKPRISIVGE